MAAPGPTAVFRPSWWKRLAMVLLVALPLSLSACSRLRWDETSRESAKLAPDPAEHAGAVVMAFRASLWGVRGWFADHTWLATKEQDADHYTVYEVIGWRRSRNQSVLRIAKDIPDRYWFGAKPSLLAEVRGPAAQELVAKIDAAAHNYPYPNEYKAFPGPNSNTFTAWVAKKVPELDLRLPLRAVGRSYHR